METRVFEVEMEARVMDDAADPEEVGREFAVVVLVEARAAPATPPPVDAPILAFPMTLLEEALEEVVDAPTLFTATLLMARLFPPFPLARTATGSYPFRPPFAMLEV